MSADPAATAIVLVIECQPRINWYTLLDGAKLPDGRTIQVEQCTWADCLITSFPDHCMCDLRRAQTPHAGTSQERNRTVRPAFVVFRSVNRGVGRMDDRNKVYALQHAGVPTLNSLESYFLCSERPWMFGELKRLQRRLGGAEHFPLIEQTFYSSSKAMLFPPPFPLVIKIGPYHSGHGKMKVVSESAFDDLRSIVAMHDDYCSVEPFINWDYDLRIQKIGPHYRAFKRTNPNWKGNVGFQIRVEEIAVTDKYRLWVDACAQLFGGLDICALDALHSMDDDKEYILELNDTAIGLATVCEAEDLQHMAALVVTRVGEALCTEVAELKP